MAKRKPAASAPSRARKTKNSTRAPIAPETQATESSSSNGASWIVVALPLLALAVAVVYARVFGAPFLPWDDDYNLYKNPYIAVGGWQHLWAEPFYGMYVPVTSTLWAALYAISGGQPWPYRIVNAVFHVANVVLVFALVREILRKTRTPSPAAAYAAAALFALHPLQVGSVAWISDLRGIMSAFFGLLATLAFFRWRNWGGAMLGAGLFALGLLSKPQIAALPLGLAVVTFALERERFAYALVRLAPWFASSFAAAWVTNGAQKAVVEWSTPLWMRPIVMLDSYGFYALKTVFPYPLMVDYGRTPGWLQANLASAIPTVAASLALLALTAYMIRRDRKWTIAGLWFVFLLPTSGIVDFGYQQISTVTDHYNYVPLMIVAAAFGMSIAPWMESARFRRRAVAASAAVVLAFAATSSQRAAVWSVERDFFSDMVEKNPTSYSGLIGLTNLSCMSTDRSEIQKGLEYAKRATMAREEDPVAVADLAVCLIRLERYADVLELEKFLSSEAFLRRLKRHDFASSSLLMSIGGVAFFLGQIDKGFAYACEGARINSMSPVAAAQIQDMQRQLAARGDMRTCGPRLGIDAALAMVRSMGPVRTPAQSAPAGSADREGSSPVKN